MEAFPSVPELLFAQLAETVLAQCPVWVIGSGLSCGAGFPGMPALADWLRQYIQPDPSDAPIWTDVQARLSAGEGLEKALLSTGDRISTALQTQIAEQTWRCVIRPEAQPLLKLALGEDVTGLVALLSRFTHSNNKLIHIITPNYDRLIEWSATIAGWRVRDGFGAGSLSKLLPSDPWDTNRADPYRESSSAHGSPCVHLYKVHGSLGWFYHNKGILRIDGLHESHLPLLRASGLSPVIVTPGTNKYRTGYHDPYAATFAEARRAIDKCRALVFVGFGFNDDHILAGLESKLTDSSTPKLIITKSLTPELKKWINEGKICNYAAVEEGDSTKSIVLSDGNIATNHAPGLWTLKGLLDAAWGMGAAK